MTALVWVAILLFLVLAASQADWKASDLILSITRRFVLEKSNTARYGLYGLVVVSFCQQENNIKRKEKQADNFIIDISDYKLDNDAVTQQIDTIFNAYNTKFVNSLTIIENGKIKKIVKRK